MCYYTITKNSFFARKDFCIHGRVKRDRYYRARYYQLSLAALRLVNACYVHVALPSVARLKASRAVRERSVSLDRRPDRDECGGAERVDGFPFALVPREVRNKHASGALRAREWR